MTDYTEDDLKAYRHLSVVGSSETKAGEFPDMLLVLSDDARYERMVAMYRKVGDEPQ